MFVSGGKAKRSRNNAEAETRKSFEDAVTKGQLSTFGFADCILADVTDRSVFSSFLELKINMSQALAR